MPEQVIEFLVDLVFGKGLILAVFSFIVGQLIKNGTPIDNKYIPIIVACIGAIMGAITNTWTVQEESIIMAAVDGFMIGGFTTGMYEMLCKNTKFKEKFGAKYNIDNIIEESTDTEDDTNEEQ